MSFPDAALAGAGRPSPVRLVADLTCVAGGGVEVTFTVRNLGRESVEIEPDFHLTLTAVRSSGRNPIAIVFVFPAPGFDVIAAGDQSTFRVPIATAEPGDPTAVLEARRLLVEAEVFLAGREHPARRVFAFPGCS
jgi:hypothetical protein